MEKEEEKRKPFSWLVALKFKHHIAKAAKIKVNILKEVNQFHWQAKDNC